MLNLLSPFPFVFSHMNHPSKSLLLPVHVITITEFGIATTWTPNQKQQGVGWCSGQPVPCGGIRSRESVRSDPALAPALEFCICCLRFALSDYITARNQGNWGLPEPSKAHASLPAGFHRVRQSNPGLWPRHSRRITRPRNDHRRSPADLPVAAWETAAVSGPRTTRPRSRCNRWQWARLMGGPGRISPGSAREGTTDTRTVWKECHALPGKP